MKLPGELQDPEIDFVGVWNGPEISDYGMFYVWNAQDGTYWSWDKLGVANIKELSINERSITFKKRYINSKGRANTTNINYSGESGDGQFYRGEWKNEKGYSGEFVLTRFLGKISEVQKRFGNLEMKALNKEIKQARDEYPHLPLFAALQY